METEQIIWWPMSTKPAYNMRCLVHAMNNFYCVAIFDEESQQFWNKDGQPVAAPIEWSYRVDRSE